ncbi:hypothetical protein G6F46_000148 [Rhizopus delemar]|uniref:CCHC-type domain-containing protein n=2 Tax=Rhizopus TaxID=4842 RepID=A0A9P6Z4J8_9FUNG|nr:hypothetical protein G6F55_000945 [Rhizopus delemar]KAG1554065.1 hypothetical protein G6F51_000212 [Rhizopus arrhizus]KAG1489386.1 hypothetical protein G6F54_011474 [Rhizopus delemar]KAG1512454.1 hypothetical protein G6F53_005170 [Rhizopus delemar]KAG1526980.1 hypothetical protein G6F52_001946 [Rhizopus delemar]
MPTYCRYCHAEGHAVPDCPKKRSSRVCWNCRASGHIAAECSKSKNKPFQKVRKTPTAPQDRIDQDEVQSSQVSSGITMSSTSPQPLTSNIMKRKRSIQNESGDDPRIHSSTLLITEEDSILSQHQAAMDSHLKDALTGYNFRHDSLDNLGSPIQAYISSDQQHGTTVFNADGAPTQSKQ